MSLLCPECGSACIKKNGHIHNGKQNHRCLVCGRQFVEKREQRILSEEKKEEIQQALLEWNLPYIQSEHAMTFRIYGRHI